MTKKQPDRRAHPRTERSLPLKISKQGLDVIAETRNLSCSGVYCRVNKAVPLMSKIGVTMLLPIHSAQKISTRKVKCNGVVVRSEPVIIQEADTACQNIAIFFTELAQKDRSTIAQYVLQSFKNNVADRRKV
ncbi:MAG: PilZ domain-containing protein [Candidatus Omnitrophica bacterium]|nr:PilZ domain-containing protein [Candidatus Omnitrophota bacterium]